MTIRLEVISTIPSRYWDFILGIEKSPNEKDQYTAVIVMYPPNTIQNSFKGEIMKEIGRYIVETGSFDEILKYKEVGAFSEWPFFRFFYNIHKNQELNDQDMKFIKWIEKTSKEYIPKSEMEAEHTKKKWWKRLLGMR